MKRTRLLMILLALVMVLGLLSSGAVCAAEDLPTSFKLDFKETAMAAAQQDWWDQLGESRHDSIKYAGCTAYKQAMTDELTQAYADLRAWLAENEIWNINEEASGLSNMWYWQSVYLNADEDMQWGLCYRPFYHGLAYSQLVLDVTIPAGCGGLYRLEMDIFRESISSDHYLVSSHPGGGRANISVNGTPVYENYNFAGDNCRAVDNLGFVQLNEGVNTITIYSTVGYAGSTSYNERCSYAMNSMEFIRLDGIEIGYDRETDVDLRNSYLAYDTVIDSTYTAVSSNESVVTAQFDENGILLLTGLSKNTANVTVRKDGTDLFTIPVSVTDDAPVTQDKLYYKLNGAKSVVLSPGAAAEGDLSCLTTQLTKLTEEDLRRDGQVYFKSGNEAVATVDQDTGNIKAIGEGSAKITAYVRLGDLTATATASVTVKDSTALASICVDAPEYLATDNSAVLAVEGQKTSGTAADMGQYTIIWSVDDDNVASVSETGRLTGIAPGTVTVTATVDGTEVSASVQVDIMENTQLLREDYLLDLTMGKSMVLETGSLEEDGVAINEELTTCTVDLGTSSGISVHPCYPGMVLALDFILPEDGWYTATTFGTSFEWGGKAYVYLDDYYMGIMDFTQMNYNSYTSPGFLNSVWLEAGKHTLVLENYKSGYFWFGKLLLEGSTACSNIDLSLRAEQKLIVGQTQELELDFTLPNGECFNLKPVEEAPKDYTNYCIITSNAPDVVSVSGNTLTAKMLGTAVITVEGEINHKPISRQIELTVTTGSVLTAQLTAEKTTLKPADGGVQLSVNAFGADGDQVAMPGGATVTYTCEDTDLAQVDQNGYVTITGKEGSALITAVIAEGVREIETSIWITTTTGKTAPSIYTYEERQNAVDNVGKYNWAWTKKEQAVSQAAFFVEHLDDYYNAIMHEGLPRSARVGVNSDPNPYTCYYCKKNIAATYGSYGWIVDPVNNPWKITCPLCKHSFPTNDFGSYYALGLDEQGRFSAERALANGGERYLVNELYPEMGESWGVDDGFGFKTGNYFADGNEQIHYYIAYYQLCLFYPLSNYSGAQYSILKGIEMLRDAYLYTGDEIYGNAGAILLDRMGDVYPDMNYRPYVQGSRGKITDYIWEGLYVQQVMATAADAFWDCFDNPQVVEYLQANHTRKGIADPAKINPQTIREHIDNNILLAIRYAIENGQSHGNFGMSQAAMAYAAVALDRLPESREMIDWVFRHGEVITINTSTGEQKWTGGDVMYTLVEQVNRNGFSNEGSITYHRMWYQNLMLVADALKGYSRVQGADLWQNPKFLDLFIAPGKISVLGNSAITTGEAGHVQGMYYYPEPDYLVQLMVNTSASQPAYRQAAQLIYEAKDGNLTGLHGTIFTADPEAGLQDTIKQIVKQDGRWKASESEMLTGEGLSILRNGPDYLVKGENDREFSDYWMFYGLNGSSHGALEALHIGIDAFGMNLTSGLGYPIVVNTYSAEREQWMRSTLSHNTVMVDEQAQLSYYGNSFPLHFDDAGKVKVMDASAPKAYAQTEIYRRSMVTVQLENDVYYAVDFFRVLGGKNHTYSFHANGLAAPVTQGLDLVHQPMGTYAGPNVELGPWITNPYTTEVSASKGSGASWLDNVYRDTTPEASFTVDFAIDDFHGRFAEESDIRLRLTMLSQTPMTEVAIADGHPSDNGINPEYVKYLLVRNEGRNSLDTMFTSVIEPYRGQSQLASSRLVQVSLLEGSESRTDKAVAIKVTRTDGQEDFIIYATNPDCLYAVCDTDGTEKFRFRGFVGVCTYENGRLTYAYGNEATQVADVIENDLPAITGTVAEFTTDLAGRYELMVDLDQMVNQQDLVGKYIYVNNDGEENGAYRIYGAEVVDTMAVLDLNTQSLIRSYADAENMAAGYAYNIAPGQTFTIPLSVSVQNDLCDHTDTTAATVYNNNKTHTTTVTCVCGEVVSTVTADCVDEDKDCTCDTCGGKIKTVTKTTVAGSNMNLGNELQVNFIVNNPVEGDYVAYIHQDTDDEGGLTIEIPEAEWEAFGT
ncbi:MAG: Ig-like domain-containing protein, partial [Oscillospiraceae bacterium]|nr:Ig-like domain-containing protein [Oscillospiraceae bacterium]